jgi:hypothetical protein
LPAPAPQAGVSTNFTIWAENGFTAQWLKGIKVFNLKINTVLKNFYFTVVPLHLYTYAPLFVPRTGLEPAHHR